MPPSDGTPPSVLAKRKAPSDRLSEQGRPQQQPKLDIGATIAQYEQYLEAHRALQQDIKDAFCVLESSCSSSLVWLNFVDRDSPSQHIHDRVVAMQDQLAGAQSQFEAFKTVSSSHAGSMSKTMAEFRQSVLSDPLWYLRGNVLCMWFLLVAWADN